MADNNKKSNFSSLSQGEGRGEALITGAEALMRSLEHQGVKTIFGYPGGASCRYSMPYTTIGRN